MKRIFAIYAALLVLLTLVALIGPHVGDKTFQSLSYAIPAAFAAEVSRLLIPVVVLVMVLTPLVDWYRKRKKIGQPPLS
ncbi:hypothetical protein LNAOJCKE_5627 [Methylorubrum aminovorans]|uniref:Uncharacterized protein n=1 Tax=Methylorubrum aminovorans TaxID=269069 RepID=A0ABQ4UMJ6_9HYPH|nr:hypothetical protein [Methylorubrum aminovorans]GJE68389.1 hypothetical protein LNAOJCKE_5627 [Methylorubrum aminovorans]GMA79890.1 hypothetical protein GCM10025880_63070 [Methylorubrum aminovorans]